MLNQYRYQCGQFVQSFYSLHLTGSDVSTFLHKQSTYDVASMQVGEFHLTSMLDPQGRVETYFWILKKENAYILLIPIRILERTISRLNKFLIAEDVEISDPKLEEWTILLGPKVQNHFKDRAHQAFFGSFFDEEAWLTNISESLSFPMIETEDVQKWRGLSGYPSLDGSDCPHDIINNHRLFDLTVSLKKGCYPGQETVSKIHYNRGAAYAPVLLKIGSRPKLESLPCEISFQGKKIGTISGLYDFENHWYLSCSLLRDFRVENLELTADVLGQSVKGKVVYFPLLASSVRAKAEELFHQASEFFKKDNLEAAEEALQLAIDLDPTYADAYESLGVILGRSERFQEAIEMMEKLSSVDPSSVMAHTNMSLYLMKLGKIEEAETQKGLATVKSFQKFGEEAKVKEEIEKKKQAEAAELLRKEEMYRQVLEIDADDTLANYGLGTIHLERAEYDQAIDCLEKVLAQDAKYSVAYLALGKAYLALRKQDSARDIFERGIKVAASKGDLMPANQMQSLLSQIRSSN